MSVISASLPPSRRVGGGMVHMQQQQHMQLHLVPPPLYPPSPTVINLPPSPLLQQGQRQRCNSWDLFVQMFRYLIFKGTVYRLSRERELQHKHNLGFYLLKVFFYKENLSKSIVCNISVSGTSNPRRVLQMKK